MGDTPGGKVGSAIADHLVKAIVATKSAMLPAEAEHAAKMRTAQMETWERELAERWKSIAPLSSSDTDMPEHLANFLHKIENPGHQTDFLFEIIALLGVAVTGAFAAAAGYNQQLTQIALKRQGAALPGESTIAAMSAARIISEGTASSWLQWHGLSADRLSATIEAGKNYPSLGALLELWRRDFIGAGAVQKALERNGVPDEYLSQMMLLKEGPPSAEVAIQAVVQSQLDPASAMEIMAEQGIDPTHFQWLFETAGSPPGIHELLELLNRGLISEADMIQAIKESRIKTKYIPQILLLRKKIPPMRSVVSMLRKKVITPEHALDNLHKLGYYDEDAAALVAEASQETHSGAKDLTVAQITESYELALITKEQAISMIAQLGFDNNESGMMLALADAKNARKAYDREVKKISSKFIAHHLTEQQASNLLDRVGMRGEARDRLLVEWTLERDSNVARLTAAQIIKLTKIAEFDEKEATKRLVNLGYTPEDAKLVLIAGDAIAPTAAQQGA